MKLENPSHVLVGGRVTWLKLAAATFALLVFPPNVGKSASMSGGSFFGPQQIQPATPVKKSENADQEDDAPESTLRVFATAEGATFLPAPRELTRPLIRARRAIAENEPNRAAELIGRFLIDSPQDDFLIAGDRKDGSSVSLRQYAESMLSALPETALKSYRFRFEIPARQQLDQAVEEGDVGVIADVMMRYFFTEAGQNAAMILGQHELDRGNPISAAASFNKVYRFAPARRRFEPELSVLLATSLSLAGDEEYATEVLTSIRDQKQFSSIEFQGNRTALPTANQNPIQWLVSLIGETELKNNPMVAQWLMNGGNARRNARVEPGLPFLQPVWAVADPSPSGETTPNVSPFQQRVVSQIVRSGTGAASNYWLQKPGIRAIGDTILLTKSEQLVGIDFRTGKRMWAFPNRTFVLNEDDLTSQQPDLARNQWINTAASRLGNDTPMEASSDGTNLYWVHSNQSSPGPVDPVLGVASPQKKALSCISLMAQGRLVWTVGGEGELESDENLEQDSGAAAENQWDSLNLEGASFLGPPLPVGSELYAICKVDQANQLVVLDRNTGALIWKQHLATNELKARGRNYVEAISPSYANGLVICPTGTGALVAIDVATRTFQWGHQYHTPTRYSSRKSKSWRDARVVIDGNYVVISASESDRLICLNLESGKPIANFGKTGVDVPNGMYFACVENENAIIVTRDSVAAYKLADRSLAWTRPIKDYGAPSGEGFAARGYYFFPTTERYLIKIDLKDGKVVETVDTAEVLGNLVSFRGSVLSFDGQRLTRFDTQQNTADEIEQALAKVDSPKELPPRINLQRSRLFARNKQWLKAMEALDLAAQNGDLVGEKQERLFLILRMLDNDIDGAKEQVDQYWDTFNEIDRNKLYSTLIDYLIRQKKTPEALSKLIEWEKRQSSIDAFSPPNEQRELTDAFSIEQEVQGFDNAIVKVENFVISDRDRVRLSKAQWFKTKLSLILDASPDAKAEIENLVRQQLTELNDASSVERHRTLLKFPAAAIPADISVRLANDLIDSGEWNRAKQVIIGLIGFDPGKVIAFTKGDIDSRKTISMEGLEVWFRYVSKLNYVDTANHVFQLIESKTIDVELSGDQSIEQAIETMRGALKKEPKANDTQTLSGLWSDYNGAKAASENTGKYNSNLAFEVSQRDTRFSRLESMVIASHMASRELEFFDEQGNSIQTLATPNIASTSVRDFLEIEHDDNLAIFKRGRSLATIDLAKLPSSPAEALLWDGAHYTTNDRFAMAHRKLAGEMPIDRTNSRNQNPVTTLSVNGICKADPSILSCLDPFTGSVRWTRPIKSNSPWLLGDDQYVTLVNHEARTAEVYELETGRRLKVIPLPERFGAVYDSVGARAVSIASMPFSRIKEIEKGTAKPIAGNPHANLVTGVSPAGNRLVLGMYDFQEESFLWVKNLLPKAKVTRLSHQRFAVFPETGNLKVFDLASGDKLGQVELNWDNEELKKVQVIGSTRIGSSDLIVFNKAQATLTSLGAANAVTTQRLLSHHVFFNGTVILLDRDTIQPKWRNPVELAGFSLLEMVPNDSPMIFFQRRVQSSSSSALGRIPRSHHLFGVDRETGEARLSFVHPSTTVQLSGPITCDPERQKLELDLGRYIVKIRTGNDSDQPPGPVAYSGLSNPLPIERASSTASPLKIELIQKEIDQRKLDVLKTAEELESLRERERKLLQKEFDAKRD